MSASAADADSDLVAMEKLAGAVVEELQKKGFWKGADATDVKVNLNRPGIGFFHNTKASTESDEKNSHATVVVKCLGAMEMSGACQCVMAEAGVAVPLLARGADFHVEALGEPVWNTSGKGDDEKEQMVRDFYDAGAYRDEGRLVARLHKTKLDWFTAEHRVTLQELMPILVEEPENSFLYTCAAKNLSRGVSKEQMAAAPIDQVRKLMAILPRTKGHGARLVNVHGDIWIDNMLWYDGKLMLTDFETCCPSSAAADMVISAKGLAVSLDRCRSYLQAMMFSDDGTGASEGGECVSEDDVYDFFVECLIAVGICHEVMRPLFWEHRFALLESLIETKVPKFVEWCAKARDCTLAEKKLFLSNEDGTLIEEPPPEIWK